MRPNITESELDAALAEAFHSQPRFAAYVLNHCGFTAAIGPLNVRRQVQHREASGTADLVVTVGSIGSPSAVLLIENKIDAAFTPDQPKRYARSKEAYLAEGALRVATVLTCPSVYSRSSRLATEFDVTMTYEELAMVAGPETAQLLATAIARAEVPYEPEPVDAVMSFFDAYEAIARRVAPELVVKRNPNSSGARPKGSYTIYFDVRRALGRYNFLPTVRFSHQCQDSGAPTPSVKIMLADWARHTERLRTVATADLIGTGFELRPAGQSLGIAAPTPRLNNMRPAHEQENEITEGLNAARRLRSWFRTNGATLQRWASALL